MHTVDVSREDWPRFLREFSSIHDGWLVSLEVMDADLGVQPQLRSVPLRGVVAETTSREPSIIIAGGRAEDGHITHTVHEPTHVRVERTPEGADVALEIESADGVRTLVRFKTVALPETVDGVARLI
jgi:hypothetical protein